VAVVDVTSEEDGTKPKKKCKAKHQAAVPQYDEHLLSVDELALRLKTAAGEGTAENSPGLGSEEAADRLAADGPNVLTPPRKETTLERLVRLSSDPFMLLLLLAAILSFIAYAVSSTAHADLGLGVILVAVVMFSVLLASYQVYILLRIYATHIIYVPQLHTDNLEQPRARNQLYYTSYNTLGSLLQEGQASDVMASFAGMLPPTVRVCRAGKTRECLAADLVCGDVVLLQYGNVVPADMRIISSQNLQTDMSGLTGESKPIKLQVKSADDHFMEVTLRFECGAKTFLTPCQMLIQSQRATIDSSTQQSTRFVLTDW
jgi:magnesium-transporting ATPase (P-type)